MERIPEEELMQGEEQALAYASADFTVAHNLFVETFKQKCPNIPLNFNDVMLDLGCGPCDVTRRMAKAYPDAGFHGIDGSKTMLSQAEKLNQQHGLTSRIDLLQATLPTKELPQQLYHCIISNSLLHHLHEPDVLWKTIKQTAKPYASCFVMDLIRPVDEQTINFLSAEYVANEPEILKTDFENSLRAAFTIDEVKQQLQQQELNQLVVEQVDELHFAVYGEL